MAHANDAIHGAQLLMQYYDEVKKGENEQIAAEHDNVLADIAHLMYENGVLIHLARMVGEVRANHVKLVLDFAKREDE